MFNNKVLEESQRKLENTVNIDGQKLLSFISKVDILVKALKEIAEMSEEWEEQNAVLLGSKAKAALIEFSKGETTNVSK